MSAALPHIVAALAGGLAIASLAHDLPIAISHARTLSRHLAAMEG